MSQEQLVALLLGPLGLLVGSLLLNLLQGRGTILSRKVVPREDYEALRVINASYADKFGQQTDAVKVLSGAVSDLAALRPVRR